MSGDAANPIDYAPPLSILRRGRTRRRIIWGTIALLVVAASPWWVPAVYERLHTLALYRACRTHAPPPDQIIYTEERNHVSRLAGAPGYQFDRNSAWYVPAAWDRFYAKVSPPGLRSKGTLFLHGRRSPAGAERLVAVDLSFQSVGPADARRRRPLFTVNAFETGAPIERPRAVSARAAWGRGLTPLFPPTTVYAGQPDPADPSHFTIAFKGAGGESAVIDGWLRDDDSVFLDVREVPSVSPAPSGSLTPSAPPSPE